jgi:hypothetical protein
MAPGYRPDGFELASRDALAGLDVATRARLEPFVP